MSEADRRERLAIELLGTPYAELGEVKRRVIDLIVAEAPSGISPALKTDERTFWDRLADRVAQIGGSWSFIFGFAAALFLWTGWNVIARGFGLAFDPYPFIFLNLLLSTLAAIQAPVIMMSQNRQAKLDREAAEHDYLVNMRAELEIMHLHDKLDAMRSRELVELLERQNETLTLIRSQVAALAAEAKPGPPA
ncbi:DUF1003 domain-containing protein [Phenylobacterium sp.]|uniref:DUF1003 domain-containing protein n=1 Tax=Phenylobacterium sp. TaxID=1871053 RepID=UPI0035B25E7B